MRKHIIEAPRGSAGPRLSQTGPCCWSLLPSVRPALLGAGQAVPVRGGHGEGRPGGLLPALAGVFPKSCQGFSLCKVLRLLRIQVSAPGGASPWLSVGAAVRGRPQPRRACQPGLNGRWALPVPASRCPRERGRGVLGMPGSWRSSLCPPNPRQVPGRCRRSRVSGGRSSELALLGLAPVPGWVKRTAPAGTRRDPLVSSRWCLRWCKTQMRVSAADSSQPSPKRASGRCWG